VIVMLERTGEVVTPGLVVEARLTSGRPVRAKLDLADVAVLRDIPVADLGSLVLSFHTERPAP
jgi:hypothetical protein